MDILQLFNCVRGQHVRSRGYAWQDGDITRSKCRGCGRRMARHAGTWKIEAHRPNPYLGD